MIDTYLRAMQKIAILLLLLSLTFFCQAQNITQTVRGTIVDKISKSPIIGATVVLSDKTKGTKADVNGRFQLKNIPIGRVSLIVTSVGKQPLYLNNLEVNSTNQLVLNLEMEDRVTRTKKVVIRSKKDKSKTLNEMVSVSGRTFSVEETQRYAGSKNDIARMAQSFAGVQGSNDARNDIVVRGNSPVGVLYRLEGMDIPNPNHFAAAGTTGGPISMINNNVLANSDFLTSAFPAQYMNATSGIFDLNLRSGNNQEYEFLGQIGFNGIELNAEGPLSKKNKNSSNSFIVGYRYSTLSVFNALGVNFGTGTAVPKYQDGSFKLKFSDKKGSTTLFGIGGVSNVKLWDSENEGASLFGDSGQDFNYRTNTGLIGLSRSYLISKKSYTKTTLAIRANSTKTILDTFTTNPDLDKAPFYRDNSYEGAISLHSFYQTKFSAKTNLRVGAYLDRNFFKLTDSVFVGARNSFVNLTNYKGALYTIKPYAQLQYKYSEKLQTVIGISSIYFPYNNTFSLEPRLGITYNVNSKSSLALGYGLHSKIAPFRSYFIETEITPNNFGTTNDNLGFSKAHHIVLAYDRNLNKHTRIKLETYYQHLFNVPVSRFTNTFSLLNQGAEFGVQLQDSMVNGGTGDNYGAELTFEHFLHKGFYYLVTGSVYRSTYEPSDGKTYPTAFDGRYAANVLGGREFMLKEKLSTSGKAKQYSFTLDFKSLINGGLRYTPIDLEESIIAGEAVFDNTRAFSERHKPYFRIDFRIGFKVQTKKVTHEWAFDIQNVTNQKNIFAVRFDPNELALKESYQTGLLPVFQYRVRF
jgi:hypothetical protein